MLLHPTEMHIQLMQVLNQGAQGGALGHLGEGVHILGEALAAVAQLAVGAGHVGVRVVDVARKQYARVHLAPVGSHLLAVFAAGVEVGDLVGAKHVVHILGELGLEGRHHRELLADKNLGQQLMCTSEHHGLLLEVLDMRALGEELGHVAHLVAGLFGEPVAGARKNGGADKDRYIRKLFDQFRHQSQILRAVVFCWHMNLKECNIHIAQVIIISLRRITDEKLALRVVVFQPVFEGSTHEPREQRAQRPNSFGLCRVATEEGVSQAASDNSNVNHFCRYLNSYILSIIFDFSSSHFLHQPSNLIRTWYEYFTLILTI